MIIEIVIQLTLVAIAAMSNAVMDTLDHHFNKSIFQDKDKMFWKKSVSWRRKYAIADWIPDAVSDAWHIAKTTMIFCLLAAILVTPIFHVSAITWLIHYGILGLVWNGVFNLFNNKILIRK